MKRRSIRKLIGRLIIPAALAALVDALQKARPAAAKGIYLRKLAVSSTMGGGARVEIASLSATN